jgi:hypothetical protein
MVAAGAAPSPSHSYEVVGQPFNPARAAVLAPSLTHTAEGTSAAATTSCTVSPAAGEQQEFKAATAAAPEDEESGSSGRRERRRSVSIVNWVAVRSASSRRADPADSSRPDGLPAGQRKAARSSSSRAVSFAESSASVAQGGLHKRPAADADTRGSSGRLRSTSLARTKSVSLAKLRPRYLLPIACIWAITAGHAQHAARTALTVASARAGAAAAGCKDHRAKPGGVGGLQADRQRLFGAAGRVGDSGAGATAGCEGCEQPPAAERTPRDGNARPTWPDLVPRVRALVRRLAGRRNVTACCPLSSAGAMALLTAGVHDTQVEPPP